MRAMLDNLRFAASAEFGAAFSLPALERIIARQHVAVPQPPISPPTFDPKLVAETQARRFRQQAVAAFGFVL